MTAKKEYWQINTERIADEIRSAASEARTEEDLKMRVEPILRKSFKDIGVDIDIVAYEKAFPKGPQPGGSGEGGWRTTK
jgi:hypothetical protein